MIAIVDDVDAESAEQFTVTLQNAVGGANIGMQSGAQMTLRNVTVRNGNGIFLTADCTIVLENVIFEACNYSALTTPGSTTIYRNCVFRNMSEAAISAQGETNQWRFRSLRSSAGWPLV